MCADTVTTNQNLAAILARQGLVPADILGRLIGRAQERKEWLGRVALDDNLVNDRELAKALSQEVGLPLADLSAITPDPAALACLSEDICRTKMLVPLSLAENALTVAVANPLDPDVQALLASLPQSQTALQVAPYGKIANAIDRWYRDFTPPPVRSDEERSRRASPGIDAAQMAVLEAGEMCLDDLLALMMARSASDLHLSVGLPPLMRVHGELCPIPHASLQPQDTVNSIYPILSEEQRAHFEERCELDLAYSLPGTGRFRVNVFRQRGSVGAVLRAIPTEVPTLSDLDLPPVLQQLCSLPRGLVLITGPTGSGKSTTLAAMINEINQTRRAHIMTIEDPIEFLHKPALSEINQREVGTDTQSFISALRQVLRQDPDIILIGEMRDLETIAAGITAAETGHLVFATLHTNSAAQTLDRIIDVFPSVQQAQIRSQLANVLEAILTQVLLASADGKGRCCVTEVLVATTAIRSMMRDGKVHQVPNAIELGAQQGMQTLDQSLKKLVLDQKVTLEEAMAKSQTPMDLKSAVESG